MNHVWLGTTSNSYQHDLHKCPILIFPATQGQSWWREWRQIVTRVNVWIEMNEFWTHGSMPANARRRLNVTFCPPPSSIKRLILPSMKVFKQNTFSWIDSFSGNFFWIQYKNDWSWWWLININSVLESHNWKWCQPSRNIISSKLISQGN